jgi:putative spermidine/putrescine transport system permease protein
MSRRTAAFLLLPAVTVVVILLAVPLLYLLGYGFLDTQYGQDQIQGVTLAHYRKVLSDPFFLRIFAKTLLLSALTTAVVSVFGYALAHFIWRQRRWRALFVSLAVSPLLVSIVVSSYGWMVILGNNGIINRLLLALGAANSPVKLIYTDAAIVVGLVHITLPFMILSILAALERIDEFLPEAASTLGANPTQVLRHVILPLALPGFAAGTTVVFCLSMSAYVTPAVLGGSGPNFITTLIYNEFITQLNWPVGAALASLLLLISLSIVFGYIRFMSRLNVGSAKAET